MRRKICFLGGARYPQPLDTTSAKKFRALEKLGEIFVIGFSGNMRYRSFAEQATFYLLPQLPFPILRYLELFTVAPLLACWVIFRYRVQVLIAQSPYEAIPAALAKGIAGWFGHRIALVVESHGDFNESLFLYRRVALPALYRFLMRNAVSFALRHADVLRAVSNSTKEQLKRSGADSPVIQFPAWTDIEAFFEEGRRSDVAPGRNVLYAGVLSPVKGVHHLINAFARISKNRDDIALVIIGRESHKIYAAELKEQVRRNGLDDRVCFVGEISQAELARWMRTACVFILPSVSEGLPRVIVEAMAVGLPVIATDVGGVKELVQEGSTGLLVPPADEVTLAERLFWVLQHPEEANQMGRRARRFATGLFSTEAYVFGYQQILDTAQLKLSEPRKHAPSTV